MHGLIAAFHERAHRLRLYAVLAASFFVLGLAGAARHGTEVNLVHSDGRGYYVYLPSLVVDGDLDFSNQIREHYQVGFRPLGSRDEETGLVWNKFPIGVALSLLPAFLVAHVLSLGAFWVSGSPLVAPHGYSLLYQCLGFAAILAYAFGTFAIVDRWLTERFRVEGPAVALASTAFWVGTHYAFYSFYNAFMCHLASAFWVAASVDLVLTLRDRLEEERWPGRRLAALAFALSMAVTCRPSNLFVAPLLVWLLIAAARRGRLGALLRALPLTVPALAPLGLQVLTWHALTGHNLVDPYRHEGFTRWANPCLVQTLFSSRHGLFWWSPLLLLSAWGVARRLRAAGGGDGFLPAWLGSFAILWYANSSWYAWWFGESFGARAFLELAPLFVMGLAFAYEDARRRGPRASSLAASASLVAIAWSWLLLGLWSGGWISRQAALL